MIKETKMKEHGGIMKYRGVLVIEGNWKGRCDDDGE